jgi:glycosyltransferase involved in cell wall biosynthesis
MKVLCLIDGEVKPGDRWLWKYLPGNTDQIDFLVTKGVTDRFQKWGKLLSYYPAFLRSGVRALVKTWRTSYDLVLAWEGKNGFPYALLRSLIGQKNPPLIIAAFNIRGIISHFPGLVRFGLRSVSRVIVFTPVEVEAYQKRFGLPASAICYCPHGWYDPMRWYDPATIQRSGGIANNEQYVLASGRSYRDYATLARAAEGADVKVKISGRPFNLSGMTFPDNVQATGWLSERTFLDYLYCSNFYVVPLQPINHAGGDSSVLQAMSFGKAVVATRAPSTEAYVQHGETGLLVEPRDVEGMRRAIVHLWQNPAEAEKLGREARRRFEANHTIEKLAERIYGVAREVACAQGR